MSKTTAEMSNSGDEAVQVVAARDVTVVRVEVHNWSLQVCPGLSRYRGVSLDDLDDWSIGHRVH